MEAKAADGVSGTACTTPPPRCSCCQAMEESGLGREELAGLNREELVDQVLALGSQIGEAAGFGKAMIAVGETVILLHPPLPLAVVSIRIKRGVSSK